jgi:hypothetical protein
MANQQHRARGVCGQSGSERSCNAPRRSRGLLVGAVAMVVLMTGAGVVRAADTAAPVGSATVAQNNAGPFVVSEFEIEYARRHPKLPAIEALERTPITFGVEGDVYTAPRPGVKTTKVTLAELRGTTHEFTAGAIHAISIGLVDAVNQRGVAGVVVAPDEKDFVGTIKTNDRGQIVEFAGKDLRTGGRKALRIIITTGVVTEVRTVAAGEKIKGNRVNLAEDKRIRAGSPVQNGDLLNKAEVDDYVLRLNRIPGRRVDVAVAAGTNEGEMTLDYLVNRTKPWTIYAQGSNTGTKQTQQWRERFGFIDNQLTGNDDILSIDYTTAGFEDSHSVEGAYEAPIPYLENVRGRVYGSFNEFTASDVGQVNEKFDGKDYTIGAEGIVNIYQNRALFVDAVGGMRWQDVEVENSANSPAKARGDFVLPYVALRAERNTETSTFAASGTLLGGFNNESEKRRNGLGRLNTDTEWAEFQLDASYSFFLEPIFDPRGYESATNTLAHEVALFARGQTSFGARVSPEFEETEGGLFSIRGYKESVTSGDTAWSTTAEYRFHLPRAIKVQPYPERTPLFGGPFRLAPQQAFGRPDWDLIFRGFFDMGQTLISDKSKTEHDQFLAGTGVGVELQILQNFTARIDYGVALNDVPGEVSAGSQRVHFLFTVLY